MTLAVAIAIAVSLALTPVAKTLARRCNAVANPDGKRRLHVQPTPLWGGGSVYLAALLSATLGHYLAGNNSLTMPTGLALSAGLLCVLGCYDDLFEMKARWKLAGQILSTVPIVVAGGCVHRLELFGTPIELGALGILFTIGWLVLGINAINLLDGMDGLASTVGIAISFGITAVAVSLNHPAIMMLALVLAGALVGFLAYNVPPARIYLGDCGSMLIGLTLAFLVLRVSSATEGSANLTIAVSLMFIPLLDTGLAIVRRTLNGSGFMVADRGHVHHRLLDRGLSVWAVLGVLGGLTLLSGAIAWSASASGNELWAWLILPMLVALLVNRRLLGHAEWQLGRQFLARSVSRFARFSPAKSWQTAAALVRHSVTRAIGRIRPKQAPIQLRLVVAPPASEELEPVEITRNDHLSNQSDTGPKDSRLAA